MAAQLECGARPACGSGPSVTYRTSVPYSGPWNQPPDSQGWGGACLPGVPEGPLQGGHRGLATRPRSPLRIQADRGHALVPT